MNFVTNEKSKPTLGFVKDGNVVWEDPQRPDVNGNCMHDVVITVSSHPIISEAFV